MIRTIIFRNIKNIWIFNKEIEKIYKSKKLVKKMKIDFYNENKIKK